MYLYLYYFYKYDGIFNKNKLIKNRVFYNDLK